VKYLINLLIFLFTFSFLLFTSAGCSSATGPITTSSPGRRDYTWTVDTLNIPYTVLTSMWGSSPTDVWAVGTGDKDKNIFHFTGEKWVNDGISRSLNPAAVFGFSSNNVWFGSMGNSIWHYDGNTLSKFQDYIIPNYPWAGIQNIWGDNPDNVYAVGVADSNNFRKGVIQHFSGSQWVTIYTSSGNSIYENFIKIYRSNSTDRNYYILSYYGNDADTSKIYQFDGAKLKEIYSSPITRMESADLGIVSNEVYFILGYRICILQNNIFQTLLTVPGNNFLMGISGRSRNDIFLEMTDGIAHYNGSDVEYLYHFINPNIGIYGTPLVFEKEVFILAYDFTNKLNLIFRGTLK
jgi:hypothetical protein